MGPAPVQVSERVAGLEEPRHGLAFRYGTPAFYALAQVLALNEVHDQVLPLTGDHEVVRDARQVRVPQAGQDPGFPFELPGVIFRSEQIFLDGHYDVEALIPGLINRAHTSLAKDAFDMIPIVKSLT